MLNGSQLFSLHKNEFKAVSSEEGARVYSQVTVHHAMLEVLAPLGSQGAESQGSWFLSQHWEGSEVWGLAQEVGSQDSGSIPALGGERGLVDEGRLGLGAWTPGFHPNSLPFQDSRKISELEAVMERQKKKVDSETEVSSL